MNFIESDTTLKVDDLVFSSYHKGQYIFKIVSIERRFLTKHDIYVYREVYHGCTIGDEYEPLMKVELVEDLSIFPLNKKIKKIVATLDATYLTKVNPKTISNHIERLHQIIATHWT